MCHVDPLCTSSFPIHDDQISHHLYLLQCNVELGDVDCIRHHVSHGLSGDLVDWRNGFSVHQEFFGVPDRKVLKYLTFDKGPSRSVRETTRVFEFSRSGIFHMSMVRPHMYVTSMSMVDSSVYVPICGNRVQRGCLSNPSCTLGSNSYTSNPAAPTYCEKN